MGNERCERLLDGAMCLRRLKEIYGYLWRVSQLDGWCLSQNVVRFLCLVVLLVVVQYPFDQAAANKARSKRPQSAPKQPPKSS